MAENGTTKPGGETSSARQLPGDEGLWFFIAADMVLFLLLFGSFVSEQAVNRVQYDSGREQLLPTIATLNTIFLLTSSWTVALAVAATRQEKPRRAKRYLAATIALGTGFIVAKIFEYAAEVKNGISLASSEFFTFYFIITGLHLIHVIGGVTFLSVVRNRLRSVVAGTQPIKLVESGASFWHVVDVLWLVIFPLLYLLW